MGVIGEAGIRSQVKRGQRDTNEKLDALIAEQRRTNQLLEQLLARLAPQQYSLLPPGMRQVPPAAAQ